MFATVCVCTASFTVLFSLEKLKTGENMEVTKCMRWQGQELLYQSQEALLPGSRNNSHWLWARGLSSILLCLDAEQWPNYTHTHTQCDRWLGYFLCVLIQTCSQQVEPCDLYSLPIFRVVSPFCTWPLITKKLWYWKWNWGQWGVKSKKVAEKEVLDWCYMQCDPLVVFFGVRRDSPSLRCPLFLSHSALSFPLFLSRPPTPLFR